MADDIDSNPPDIQQQADGRFVHALLLHMHDERALQYREQRVERAMLALREPGIATPRGDNGSAARPAGRSLQIPAWARRTAWAAAAMVLVAACIFAMTYSPAPALASLSDILGALNRPGDRAYRITVQPPDPPSQGKVGLDRATLDLRDGSQYLLIRLDPKGGFQFDGYDGRQSWRISGGQVAETKEGLGAGGLGLTETMPDTLFSDLEPTLKQIGTDYTIERFDLAPLPAGGPPLRHVLASRKSRDVKGPVVIEIWADTKTGMPRRIVFDQAKFQGSTLPRRLTFDLVSEDVMPADWFTPAPHTAGKIGASPRPAR
jgi:hypothetical protein